MSVIVALIGIINTLSLSILERRRELGLLRVVGMTDKRVQRMVRLESVLIAAPRHGHRRRRSGLFVGWALIRAIDRLSDANVGAQPPVGTLGARARARRRARRAGLADPGTALDPPRGARRDPVHVTNGPSTDQADGGGDAGRRAAEAEGRTRRSSSVSQIELLKMQLWVKEEGERVAIVFEGRDAAGKGGAIKRFTEHLNPRGARVVALPKPTDLERSQWYFQRYVTHLPTAGEIVLFDRSWYNRAGVERVMGFATPAQVEQFLRQAPDLRGAPRRRRHPALQALVHGVAGGAAPAVRGSPRRSAEAVEAVPDRRGRDRALRRVRRGARRHAAPHRHAAAPRGRSSTPT